MSHETRTALYWHLRAVLTLNTGGKVRTLMRRQGDLAVSGVCNQVLAFGYIRELATPGREVIEAGVLYRKDYRCMIPIMIDPEIFEGLLGYEQAQLITAFLIEEGVIR